MQKKYRPRKLKFSGEQSFIANGGMDKKILMMTAEPKVKAIPLDVLQPTTGTVNNPNQSPPIIAEPPFLFTFPNWETLGCNKIIEEIKKLEDILMTSKFSDDIIQLYHTQIALGKSTYQSKGCSTSQPTIKKEPVWESLSCEQVKSVIDEFASELNNSAIEKGVYAIYLGYIENGKKYYSEMCRKKIRNKPILKDITQAPTTTITTSGTPIIATSGSWLSGGGGSTASNEVTAVKEKKKGFQWWWLFVIAGGLYLISRIKKA